MRTGLLIETIGEWIVGYAFFGEGTGNVIPKPPGTNAFSDALRQSLRILRLDLQKKMDTRPNVVI